MENEIEIYVHIPFCVKKCLYCDFLSAPYGEETKQAYMWALSEEIRGKAPVYDAFQVSSVFIGGGTPSVLGTESMTSLMRTIRENYCLREDAEITVEINPGTVGGEGEGKDKLSAYRKVGINRLSIGLQSANDEELGKLGRIHSYGQFLETYQAAVNAGFGNINVDLMCDIPGQTKESYLHTLETVTNLSPTPRHISIYSLMIEEGTPFYEMQKRGELDILEEDADRELYGETKRILHRKGYQRYEISNYAKPGYACSHNCGYWQRKNYIGFGIGAASLFDNTRFKNGDEIGEYIKNPCGVVRDVEKLDEADCMEEFMFLGLRMMEGVSHEKFKESFGREMMEVYGGVIAKNKEDGLLWEYEKGGRKFLALTDRGIDVSNYVFARFLNR